MWSMLKNKNTHPRSSPCSNHDAADTLAHFVKRGSRYREADVFSMCEVGLVGGYGGVRMGNNVDSEIDLIRLENVAHKC